MQAAPIKPVNQEEVKPAIFQFQVCVLVVEAKQVTQ
jgi:hypothetical protein